MNIRNDSAGAVSHEHILSKGFRVFETMKGNDMGQMEWEIPQYSNGSIVITGGYWNWVVKDAEGQALWEGWWNSNDEFDEVMNTLNSNL